MYSTKFDSELRYVVTCITNQTAVRVVETIVDTGAKYTCYRASFIDDRLKEMLILKSCIFLQIATSCKHLFWKQREIINVLSLHIYLREKGRKSGTVLVRLKMATLKPPFLL